MTDASLKNIAKSTFTIEIMHSRLAAFVGLRDGIIGLDWTSCIAKKTTEMLTCTPQ